MAKQYIGITLGPIVDTIIQAKSPAALWFASGYFSDLTKAICKALNEAFDDITIYSPFYDEIKAKQEEDNWDGVGKYHDRIIFSTERFEQNIMKEIIKNAKYKSCDNFGINFCKEEEKSFINDYLQIHYVVLEENSFSNGPILGLSPYLDALELMKTFPNKNDNNPFRRFFAGKNAGKNEWIKESYLFSKIQRKDNQFRKNTSDSIRSIEDIAGCGNKIQSEIEKKWTHYFAVVSADGDQMGRFLQTLKESDITTFSKACLHYNEIASKIIDTFGGMTIYAGGDDLLFLAPVRNQNEESIFSLCNSIQKEFRSLISEEMKAIGITEDFIPTLSFGVSIQYYKHPLYEALENARKLLYIAKSDGEISKNNTTIELRKHSGQSISFQVKNNQIDVLEKLLMEKDSIEEIQKSTDWNSVIYKLELYKEALAVVERQITDENYQKIWENLFDNSGQKQFEQYMKYLCQYYYDNFLCKEERVAYNLYQKGDKLQDFITCLRFKKFLTEGGAEE